MGQESPVDSVGKIVVFGAKQIRRVWHEEQWFFSVVDIIAVKNGTISKHGFIAGDWGRCRRQLWLG